MELLACGWLQQIVGFLVVCVSTLLAWCCVRRSTTKTVAFFHPFANSGGGGERVLWHCVRALRSSRPSLKITIYTGDQIPDEEILDNVKSRFGLDIDGVAFVRLKLRSLVLPHWYPRFTMIGQSFGSVILAFEALWKLRPRVFIDTTGYAFTYPIAYALFGCTVVCYTHYPTISTDMLGKVQSRESSHNNNASISRNPLLSQAKILYYKMFAWAYGLVGSFSSLVMVNSTWTFNHINTLWSVKNRLHILFPPCDCTEMQQYPLKNRERQIVSVGQFRPEKDHPLQIKAFAKFCKEEKFTSIDDPNAVRLTLIGGARNDDDRRRVKDLKALCSELGVQDLVEFKENAPYPELLSSLASAQCGIHTMWNEHFGICVVEYMASGVCVLAHDSGGPRSDIVVPCDGEPTGFLATTVDEYCERLRFIFNSQNASEVERIRENGRRRAAEFSAEHFESKFASLFDPVFVNAAWSWPFTSMRID